MIMKRDNFLMKFTNTETGESRYFTKDSYAQLWIGCSISGLSQIKSNTSLKYKQWEYELIDGSEIKYKDINIL